jgi:hypothetical protein
MHSLHAPAEGFWPSVVVVVCDWRCDFGVVLAAGLMVVWWGFVSSGGFSP